MNTNDLLRKQIKITVLKLADVTDQLSAYYAGIRWFCFKKIVICFSAVFISILSLIFPEIRKSPFALLFFLLITGCVQLLAFKENNRILKKYYISYENGVKNMIKLSNLTDWSSLRKYYFKKGDEYPSHIISIFMQESNRPLSPIRRGFKYYRLIQYFIILVWSFIVVCFAPMAYNWGVSLLKVNFP